MTVIYVDTRQFDTPYKRYKTGIDIIFKYSDAEYLINKIRIIVHFLRTKKNQRIHNLAMKAICEERTNDSILNLENIHKYHDIKYNLAVNARLGSLPLEILVKISSFLNPKSIMFLAFTCKTFYCLLTSNLVINPNLVHRISDSDIFKKIIQHTIENNQKHPYDAHDMLRNLTYYKRIELHNSMDKFLDMLCGYSKFYLKEYNSLWEDCDYDLERETNKKKLPSPRLERSEIDSFYQYDDYGDCIDGNCGNFGCNRC